MDILVIVAVVVVAAFVLGGWHLDRPHYKGHLGGYGSLLYLIAAVVIILVVIRLAQGAARPLMIEPWHLLLGAVAAPGVLATVRERLGDYAHEAWSGWMRYLFSKCRPNPDGSLTIPKEFVDRWTRQVATPYKDLSDKEQASDLVEADRMLAITGDTDALVRAARSALSATRGWGKAGDISCKYIADELQKALETFDERRGDSEPGAGSTDQPGAGGSVLAG